MNCLRTLATLSFMLAIPTVILGCPKKTVVADTDSGLPPPVVIDAAPTLLAPLDEDAGYDAGPDANKPKHTGGGLSTNQLRAKQCCTALRTQAKALGNSPEAQQLLSIAAMCDGVAVQIGPTSGGQAPELAPLRQILQGKSVPPLCQGL